MYLITNSSITYFILLFNLVAIKAAVRILYLMLSIIFHDPHALERMKRGYQSFPVPNIYLFNILLFTSMTQPCCRYIIRIVYYFVFGTLWFFDDDVARVPRRSLGTQFCTYGHGQLLLNGNAYFGRTTTTAVGLVKR